MFSLEYVNDINIQEAVIHILDSNSPDPILNEFTLELTEDIYKFLYRHIEKCFKDEELKTAVFKEERNIVKEIVQDYLNGVDHDIVNLSKELARQLFAIMNGNTNIPSCDLIVVSLITDQGAMIGILKMDYVKNYTHQVDFVEDKIGIGIVPFLKYLVNLDQDIPYLTVYYLLYLANTVASYLVVYKTCILNADQKNYLVSKYNTIFSLLSTIACAVFLVITKNFLIYLIVQVIFTYANNFYVSHVAQKLYPYISNKVEQLSKIEEKKIFDNVKSVFIYKVANTLVGSTDNTLISILIGTVTVGYYSNYTMIVNNIQMVINIIFSSVTASIGNLVVEKKAEKNYSVYKSMQFISYILSCISITGVYIMINDLIKVWLGEKYILDSIVVIAIVINMYFSVVLMPIWSYREATGMYMQTKYVMVATAAVNVVVSIILGKWIGLAGILFATSIARISTYFWYEPKLLFAQFFKRKVGSYYKGIVINVVITVIVVGITTMIFHNMSVSGWGSFFLKAVLVGIVAAIVTIIAYIWNPEMKKIVSILKNVIGKKNE